MLRRYLILSALFIVFGLTVKIQAQQLLDSADVLYIDNTSDNNTGTTGTMMNDPRYREWPPTNPVANVDGWWTNTSVVYWGGNHRRASRYGSGNNSGAHAQFYCTVQNTDSYLVYHHMNSGNSTTNAYVKFMRFGEGTPADSFRYNMLLNNTADIPTSWGSWYPLGIIDLFAADSSLTVEIGLDSLGSNTLRCDAIALVRSRKAGPSIEFGTRRFTRNIISGFDTLYRHSFYFDRAPFGFAETTFKYGFYSEKQLPVYNLGSAPLVITGFQTQTNRYSVTTPVPITIQPGKKANITIRFSPKGEETTYDTLSILNNDSLQSQAKLPLIGTGVNYNFILNASLNGSEPHWNVPSPGGKFYTVGTSWLSSSPSSWPYPVPGGNINSVVNTGADAGVAVFYQFKVPDTLSGSYFLEYAGPGGSSNAAQQVQVDVKTPFYSNPDPTLGDTQRVTGFNSRISTAVFWARIGGNKVFQLNGGDTTTVRFINPIQGGTELLRADLLRVRLVPIAPTISTSLDPQRLLNYGSVSIYDTIRQQQFNYQRNFIIGSNGETPLRVDTIYLKRNLQYKIVNMPRFPLTLPAIDGQYNLRINFLPDSILQYVDTVVVKSNDTRDSVVRVRMTGQGVGTGITVDDTDPTTFINPANPIVWAGAPDPLNMDKWYRVQGQGGVNDNRLFHYIYFNAAGGPEKIEWYPYIPFKPGSTSNDVDSFDVWVQVSANSVICTPRAKYLVRHVGPNGPDTILVNQNSTSVPGGQIGSDGRYRLGRFLFLRGGQDSHGSGTIFGSIEVINDTALVSAYYKDSVVNRARRDSFVLRADAVILQQAGLPSIVTNPWGIPQEFTLSQNFPNPFNPTTSIRFSIPVDAKVDLKVYDILGREVATILRDELKAGYYTVEWNGRNNYGAPVATGVYLYRISAGKFVQTKKMVMMK